LQELTTDFLQFLQTWSSAVYDESGSSEKSGSDSEGFSAGSGKRSLQDQEYEPSDEEDEEASQSESEETVHEQEMEVCDPAQFSFLQVLISYEFGGGYTLPLWIMVYSSLACENYTVRACRVVGIWTYVYMVT
jgi:hypothetical protein